MKGGGKKLHAAEALASYDKAIALKPDYADAHYRLATLYEKQNKTDEAVASLARSTYQRGSASTHAPADAKEIRNLKRYVDALLGELLEIALHGRDHQVLDLELDGRVGRVELPAGEG